MSFSLKMTPQKEIREIRRAANCIGAAYAFLCLWDFVLEFLIARLPPFAKFMHTVLTDDVYSELFQLTFSLLIFVPPYILACGAAGRRISSAIEFKKPKKGTALPLLLIGFGICQIGEIMANFFADTAKKIGFEPTLTAARYGTDFYGVMFAVLLTAMLPALTEEFAMRGVTIGILRPFGDGFAILLSSVMFGIGHRNLVQTPFAFVVGLGLGFVCIKSGSIFLAMAVHFLNNLFSVGLYYLNLSLDQKTASAIYLCYAILVLFCGILGVFLCRGRGELFVLEKGESELPFSRKVAVFFTSPLILVGLIVTAIQIIKI